MADTYERVANVVAQVLGVDRRQINRDSRFTEDLGADSLDHVDVVLSLEEEFAVQFPDDDAMIYSLGDAVDFIDRLVSEVDGDDQQGATSSGTAA